LGTLATELPPLVRQGTFTKEGQTIKPVERWNKSSPDTDNATMKGKYMNDRYMAETALTVHDACNAPRYRSGAFSGVLGSVWELTVNSYLVTLPPSPNVGAITMIATVTLPMPIG
jgi:hypothetical protein